MRKIFLTLLMSAILLNFALAAEKVAVWDTVAGKLKTAPNSMSSTTGETGIGLTVPTAKLHIKASGTSTGFAFKIQDSTGAEKVAILDNGNVGLGTTAPSATLQISGTLKLGTTHQGDIFYDNGTSIVRLIPGTSGQFLQTLGAASNPQWATVFKVYDSGWFAITNNNSYVKTHNLGTTKCLIKVYVAQNSDGSGWCYEGGEDTNPSNYAGTYFKALTTTTITLYTSTQWIIYKESGANSSTTGYARILMLALE